MFAKELTYKDAEKIDKILEVIKVSNGAWSDTIIEQVGISEKMLEFYYKYAISKIEPQVVFQFESVDCFGPTEELEGYLKNGGFIVDFQRIENAQMEEQHYRNLTKKDLELSIENSTKAIRNAKISNIIAALSLLLALLAFLYSFFNKK